MTQIAPGMRNHADDTRSTRERLRLDWSHAPAMRRNLTIVILAVLISLALGRIDVLALAAAPLTWLAYIRLSAKPPDAVVSETVSTIRCFEEEEFDVRVTAHCPAVVDQLTVTFRPGLAFRMCHGTVSETSTGADEASIRFTLRAVRWGLHSIGVIDVDVRTRHRLCESGDSIHAESRLAVLPRPAAVGTLSVPAVRSARIGDHLSRVPGSGVEFDRVRPFAYGDTERQINWRASMRHGTLLSNQTAAERALDVVTVVDTFGDLGRPGASTLDLTMRGAIGLADHFLRDHDRVGLVAVGGWVRWVAAATGTRQFYRVAHAVLDTIGYQSYVDPNLDQIPRTVLPPSSVVILFSPLLDPRAIAVAHDLRARGHVVTVVDVLNSEPAVHPRDSDAQLALRIWRLDRRALYVRLADAGIALVHWDGREPLNAKLRQAMRRPVLGRVR